MKCWTKKNKGFTVVEFKGFTITELLLVLQIVVLGGTWLGNAYRLVSCDFEPSYKAEIIYGVGLVFPTCVITAFVDFGE